MIHTFSSTEILWTKLIWNCNNFDFKCLLDLFDLLGDNNIEIFTKH